MNRKSTVTFFLLVCLLISAFATAQENKSKEANFASRLLTAKSSEERNQLLKSEKDLFNTELIQVLIDKGNEFRIRAEYSDATLAFELAKTIAESLNDSMQVAEALNGIGVVHYMMHAFNAALENLNKSLKLSEANGNQKGVAQSLNHIGRVHFMREDFDLALSLFHRSLSIRESLNDRAGIAESLGSIGVVHYIRAENSKAVEYLKRSLALREELNDEEGLASSLCNLGLAELELRNGESAEGYFKRSLALREKLGDKVGIGTVLSGLGVLYDYQGNYQEALYYYGKGLELAEDLGNEFQKAWCLAVIGQVYQSFGNYRLALDYYQKSLQLREKIGEKSGIAHTLNLIGNLQFIQGDYQVAREYHKKGLQLSEELQDKREIAMSFLMMGEAFKMEGDYKKALEYFQKSLVPTEETEDATRIASLLNNIAYVQNKLGNSKMAIENLNRSLKTSEHVNYKAGNVEALSLSSAIQYDQGNFVEALNFADRAVSLAKSIESLPLLWEPLTNLSKAYGALNQPDKAIQSLENAIHAIETLSLDLAGGEKEQQQYFQDKVTAYDLIVDYLVQKGGEEMEALAYAERSKARALLDVLQLGRTTIAGAMTPEELDHERNLKRKLVSVNQQLQRSKLDKTFDPTQLKELTAKLESTRLSMEQFRATVYAAHPELKTQRGEAEIVTSERINDLLTDPLDAFLEYVVTPEKTLLFLISKGPKDGAASTKVYTFNIKQSDLSAQIYDFRKLLASRNPGYRKHAVDLHKLLIGPAAEILQTKRNLVIVPDDVLWELPFQALLSTNDRYLLEDYSLSYVPSLTVLSEMKKVKTKKAKSINLFAMANPMLGTKTREQVTEIYRDAKLDPLPEAEREVKEIAKLYGDHQSSIYFGPNAREDRVKSEAGKYNLLHFATHGLINDASPLYSQILLAQGGTQGEDGLLEAWEIMSLKLNADLVVLSACDTALGKVSRGEGMIGLTWALFVAGTPTTVVSQWSVDSTSTTELMIQFYKNLQLMVTDSNSRVSVPDALRAAALNLLKKDEYRHPFYWAPFVVIGAGF